MLFNPFWCSSESYLYDGSCSNAKITSNQLTKFSLNVGGHIFLLGLGKQLLVGCGSWTEDSGDSFEVGPVEDGHCG